MGCSGVAPETLPAPKNAGDEFYSLMGMSFVERWFKLKAHPAGRWYTVVLCYNAVILY